MSARPTLHDRRPARRTVFLALGLLLVGAVVAVFFATRPPKAIGGATVADVQWRVPRQITEERPFALRLDGGVDGHAAVRTSLHTTATGERCSADPPEESTRRVLLDRKDPDQHLGRTIGDTQTFTAASSGAVRVCGWLVASSAAGDGRVVARFDRALRVQPAPATLQVSRRTRVRAGTRFALRTSTVTAGDGRRLLLLAVPEAAPTTPIAGETPEAQDSGRCRALRPARRSKEQPLRIEVPAGEGNATERLRVRFPFLSVGTWVLCTQIREADDPEPEAVDVQTLVVRESRECVTAEAAIGDRRDDLRLIRHRREVLQGRIRASRRELRAASSSRAAAKRRQREAADAARLRAYETGTKAMNQLIERVIAGARTYCPDL